MQPKNRSKKRKKKQENKQIEQSPRQTPRILLCGRKFLSHKSPSGRMRSYARGTKAALFHAIKTGDTKRTFVLLGKGKR